MRHRTDITQITRQQKRIFKLMVRRQREKEWITRKGMVETIQKGRVTTFIRDGLDSITGERKVKLSPR